MAGDGIPVVGSGGSVKSNTTIKASTNKQGVIKRKQLNNKLQKNVIPALKEAKDALKEIQTSLNKIMGTGKNDILWDGPHAKKFYTKAAANQKNNLADYKYAYNVVLKVCRVADTYKDQTD